MNRRAFLIKNTLLAQGLLLSSHSYPWQKSNAKRVIIVGAGAAGAMAANKLKSHGHDVCVLEARNRTGGRINSNRDWSKTIELGANWISYASNPGNLGWYYREESGIKTSPTSYSKFKSYDKNGNRLGLLGMGLTSLRANKELNRFFSERGEHLPDISWGEAIDRLTDYDAQSERKKAQLDIIKLGNAASVAADNQYASGKAYSINTENLVEDEQLVLNGYDQLVHYLLEGVEVKLEHKILEIEDQNGRVKVMTERGNFEGDYVLLTVPISLLQSGDIKISPEIPSGQKEAFEKMQMGIFNKAVMKFSHKFWQGDPHFLAFQKEKLKNSGIVFNYHPYTNLPILIAFHIGEDGKWLEQQEEEKIKQHWQNVFHKAFPKAEIEFEDFMNSAWHGDPFSKGSYSYVPVGSTAKDVERIFTPHGRILFAGEATSYKWHGYVHGALETGMREADRIINA
ncbi:MAG: NAD(P)/FAD-dependent oxidoreductase [Bacteroidota bacterium]